MRQTSSRLLPLDFEQAELVVRLRVIGPRLDDGSIELLGFAQAAGSLAGERCRQRLGKGLVERDVYKRQVVPRAAWLAALPYRAPAT